MTRCSDERIALYVNGDVDRDQVYAVEAHLQECNSCAVLAEELKADALSVADLVATAGRTEVVVNGRSARGRRWIPAAAAALLATLLIGMASPAFADGIKQGIHWLVVQRLNHQQAVDYLGDLSGQVRQGTPVEPLLVTASAEEAEKTAGFAALTPTYMPDGYVLKEIRIWSSASDETVRSMFQVYQRGPGATLTVAHTPVDGSAGTVTARGGKMREVEVAGGKGLLVYGALRQGGDGTAQWDEESVSLRFYRSGEAVRITATGVAPSDEELVRIAESIR